MNRAEQEKKLAQQKKEEASPEQQQEETKQDQQDPENLFQVYTWDFFALFIYCEKAEKKFFFSKKNKTKNRITR